MKAGVQPIRASRTCLEHPLRQAALWTRLVWQHQRPCELPRSATTHRPSEVFVHAPVPRQSSHVVRMFCSQDVGQSTHRSRTSTQALPSSMSSRALPAGTTRAGVARAERGRGRVRLELADTLSLLFSGGAAEDGRCGVPSALRCRSCVRVHSSGPAYCLGHRQCSILHCTRLTASGSAPIWVSSGDLTRDAASIGERRGSAHTNPRFPCSTPVLDGFLHAEREKQEHFHVHCPLIGTWR